MACLLAEIRPVQEHLKEEMLTKIEVSQKKTDANQEMLARMEAKVDANLREMRQTCWPRWKPTKKGRKPG
jgi:RNA-binding protein YhbY